MTATSANKSAPNATAETISSGFAKAGELNENMLDQNVKLNSQVSTTLQNITREWSDFVGSRLREDISLVQTIQGCRSLPDLQQAYMQFWQNAFAQYSEEMVRMLRITQGATQGAVDGAAHAANESGGAKATRH
jgi:hypothetical protein